MTRLVAQWRASGESQASFARRHQIPGWTFWYWCRKVSGERFSTGLAASAPAAFVPVRVVEPEAPVIAVVFGSGTRLDIRPGASAEVVRAVVTALQAPC